MGEDVIIPIVAHCVSARIIFDSGFNVSQQLIEPVIKLLSAMLLFKGLITLRHYSVYKAALRGAKMAY